MKKILLIIIAIIAVSVTSSVFAQKRSIMELPLFERAVLIIKKFETLHQLKDKPYYGYGHRILPGERLPQYRPLTEREADALLRKDLNKFIAFFGEFKRSDALLLGVLSYNIGPGAVKKSAVYRKLKSGDRDIFKAYTSHCKYKGKFHSGLYKRRCQELAALYIP